MSPWLISRRFDLALFGGSLSIAVIFLAIGHVTGTLDGEAPDWVWVVGVLGVDVAHVWSTGWRVFWDAEERRREGGRVASIALLAYVTLVVAHSISPGVFWSLLAYVAVFHFLRQQLGFVVLYSRKSGHAPLWEQRLDKVAVYAGTLWPVLYWHTRLPRRFAWLIEDDFVSGVPEALSQALLPVYVLILCAYVGKEIFRAVKGRPVSAGKNLVMASTWAMWFLGIVWFNSDYAFTVTNVFIHGIPYLGLIWAYGRHRETVTPQRRWHPFSVGALPIFLGGIALLAWTEEWGWDRFVWHEKAWLFPGPEFIISSGAASLLVPLLALPQATHYVLDGFLWKLTPENHLVAAALGLRAAHPNHQHR